jgi:hypothetical protein
VPTKSRAPNFADDSLDRRPGDTFAFSNPPIPPGAPIQSLPRSIRAPWAGSLFSLAEPPAPAAILQDVTHIDRIRPARLAGAFCVLANVGQRKPTKSSGFRYRLALCLLGNGLVSSRLRL